MEKIIEVKNLTKIYNELLDKPFYALNDINFTMDRGDFVCIMGPSGAGKSTFLNCISFIDTPSKGSVKIQGVDLNQLNLDKQGEMRYKTIGFVFQKFNLLNYLTIFDNISIPLTLFNEKKSVIDQKVHEISKSMGIEDLLDKYPFDCSGGQIQRASICRAIINNPKIVIADEPTGNLDSHNSNEVMKILKRLNETGISILLVTHDPMVASYSNRVIYIKDGKIEQDLVRGKCNQKEYFSKIVEMNSGELMNMLDI